MPRRRRKVQRDMRIGEKMRKAWCVQAALALDNLLNEDTPLPIQPDGQFLAQAGHPIAGPNAYAVLQLLDSRVDGFGAHATGEVEAPERCERMRRIAKPVMSRAKRGRAIARRKRGATWIDQDLVDARIDDIGQGVLMTMGVAGIRIAKDQDEKCQFVKVQAQAIPCAKHGGRQYLDQGKNRSKR